MGLLENAMLLAVPLLISIGNADLFMGTILLLMAFRLGYLLSKRRFYSRWELFKEF